MSLRRNSVKHPARSLFLKSPRTVRLKVLVLSLLACVCAGTAATQDVVDPAAASVELQSLIDEAQLAIASNRPAAGIPLAAQAQELAISLRGESHPDALYTTNLLATSYALSGRYEEAGPLFAAVLDQLNAQPSAPSFDKMVAHFNLADLQVLQRQWGLAAENFESALTIANTLGRTAQQDQIDAQSGLARIAMVLGDWDTAQARFSGLIGRAADSPDGSLLPVSEWRQKRAEALSRAGEHSLAETAYAQMLEDFAADNALALQIRTEFAEALLRGGKLASSESEFQAVTDTQLADSAIGRRALEGLGDVRVLRGRSDQAETAYSNWLAALETSGLSQSAEGQRALLKLARHHAGASRSDEAMALYRQILAIESDNAVVGQSVRSAARLELADLLFAARAFDEADSLYEYVMDRSRRLFGLSDSTHRYALEQLAFVRQANGRAEDAKQLHLQALTNRAVFDQSCDADCALQLSAYASLLSEGDGENRTGAHLKSEALLALSELERPSASQIAKLDIVFPEGLRLGVQQLRNQLFETDQPYQAVLLSSVISAPYDSRAPTQFLVSLRTLEQTSAPGLFVEPQEEALNLQRLHGELLPLLRRLKEDEVELTGIEYERFTVLKASYASLVDSARSATGRQLLSASRVGESEAFARQRLMSAVSPGSAFVSLNPMPDGIHIAFITPNRAVQRRVSRSASLERDILNSRLAIYYEGRGFGDFNTTSRLQTLYRALLSPISADLASVRGQTLLIDAQGPLRYIPFAALHDGQSYLAEHHPTVLAAAPAETASSALSPGRSLTRFAESDNPSMRSMFAGLGFQGQIFAGEAYDSGTLASVSASGPDILQIESNLILNGQNPSLSTLTLSNGEIPARSVLSTIDRAAENMDLLVLIGAATLSDIGQDPSIADSQLGSGADLAEVYALAANPEIGAVAVSLWPLSAGQRDTLLGDFYSGWVQTDASLAQALNAAQLAALDNEETANPFHWASLTLALGSE